MKNTNIMSTIKAIVLGLILSVGVGYIFADYTPPLTNPPTCTTGNPGCDAPLNVGALLQTKSGGLVLQSLTTQIFKLIDSTPGDDSGKVIVSDANGVGTWQAAPLPPLSPVFAIKANNVNGSSVVSSGTGAEIQISNGQLANSTIPLGSPNQYKMCFLVGEKHYAVGGGTNAFCKITFNSTTNQWNLTAGHGSDGDATICEARCI